MRMHDWYTAIVRIILHLLKLPLLISEPSGPPKDLQVTDFTPYRMNFTWSPPDMSDMNGVLTKYSVCIKSQHSNFSLPGLHRFIVPSTQTSYMLSDLKPYVNYSLEVRAATVAGFGPQAKIFQRTAQSGV